MLSLVIPVYKNEGGISELVQAISTLKSMLSDPLEVLFVVDGSPDDSYLLLREKLQTAALNAQLIRLSRNYGSMVAIRAGLKAANGDFFAIMAADLQEPLELVRDMFAVLSHDEADVVVGVRKDRDDPFMTRLSSNIFWALYRRFVVPDIPKGGVDVFGCNREFRDDLLALDERNSSLIALIFWLGYRRKEVSYTRLKRKHGKSAWTFRKKLTYLMDSVFAFSDLPIRWLLTIGSIGLMVSLVFAIMILVSRYMGMIDVPGYAATILTIVFFGTINVIGLGIVGSYTWRAYENTKGRPHYRVLRTHHFKPSSDGRDTM